MNPVIGVSLIIVLFAAMYAVRQAARRRVLRRQKERRARSEKTGPRSFAPNKSKRSSMRGDDDPTTVMERITISRAPPSSQGKKPK